MIINEFLFGLGFFLIFADATADYLTCPCLARRQYKDNAEKAEGLSRSMRKTIPVFLGLEVLVNCYAYYRNSLIAFLILLFLVSINQVYTWAHLRSLPAEE